MEIKKLPPFEGNKPASTRLKLTGAIGRRTNALHKDEVVDVIVRARVKNVAFPDVKVGTDYTETIREHTVEVLDGYVLEGDDTTYERACNEHASAMSEAGEDSGRLL